MIHSIAITCFVFYLGSSIAYFISLVRKNERAFQFGRFLLLAGFITQSALIYPIITSNHGPTLAQRGEYFFWLAWAIPIVYFFYGRRLDSPLVGAFVAPCTLLFLASSSYLIHIEPTPRQADLNYSMMFMHVMPALFAEISLVIVFIASAAFIIQERRIRRKISSAVVWRGPSLDSLDSISRRFVFFGFLAMGVAVLSGAIWAVTLKLSLLGGDFYQWAAILNWGVLAVLLYLRTNLAWPARRLSLITCYLAGAFIVCFVLVALLAGNEVHIGYES